MVARSRDAPTMAIERGLNSRSRSLRILPPELRMVCANRGEPQAAAGAAMLSLDFNPVPDTTQENNEHRHRIRHAAILQGSVADFRRPRSYPLVHRDLLSAAAADRQGTRPVV